MAVLFPLSNMLHHITVEYAIMITTDCSRICPGRCQGPLSAVRSYKNTTTLTSRILCPSSNWWIQIFFPI